MVASEGAAPTTEQSPCAAQQSAIVSSRPPRNALHLGPDPTCAGDGGAEISRDCEQAKFDLRQEATASRSNTAACCATAAGLKAHDAHSGSSCA